jgi:hypothetical protein
MLALDRRHFMITVSQLATMADLVYESHKPQTSGLPAGITRADKPLPPSRTGFSGAVYKANGYAAITFRGTDKTSAVDWIHNAGCHSILATQFSEAMAYARAALANLNLDIRRTYVCGHSLGGGLTKYVTHNLTQGGSAPLAGVSFNGPGLTSGAFERGLVNMLGIGAMTLHWALSRSDTPTSSGSAPIANVNIVGDLVSQIGNSAGRIHTIPPANGASDPLSCHLMTTVIPSVANCALGSMHGTQIV